MTRLDFHDQAAVAQWLAALQTAVHDLGEVADDAIAPLARRRLGRLEHVRLAGEARAALDELLAYATPEPLETKG